MNNLDKAMRNLRESKKAESDKLAKLVEKKNLTEGEFLKRDWEKLQNDPMIGAKEHWSDAYYQEVIDYGKEVKEEKLEEDIVETTTRQDLIKIQEKGSGLYDYVANNYYKMTTEELKELALDAIYVADNDGEIIQEYLDRVTERKEITEDVNNDELKVNLEEMAYAEGWSEGKLDSYIDKIEKRYNIIVSYTSQTGTKENLMKWIKTLGFEGNFEQIYKDAKEGNLEF